MISSILPNKPTSKDVTLLYWDLVLLACLKQDTEALKRYKDYGVDFNRIYTDSGDTLLHLAIDNNKPITFNLLMDFGLKLENKSFFDGTTPLNFAAIKNDLYYVEHLVDAGADVNTRDEVGFTPLLNALYFSNGNKAVVHYILDLPTVDVNIPDIIGIPSLVQAYQAGYSDIVGKIIKHESFDATYHRLLLEDIHMFPLIQKLNASSDADKMIIATYHQAKLFGFQYDFDGCFSFNQLKDHQYNCFEFEGYWNDFGMQKFAESYDRFYMDVISNSQIPEWASFTFSNVHESLDFSSKNDANILKYYERVNYAGDLTFIPSGWDDHSIAFVVHEDRLYRCNRGNLSDGIHGIEEFKITKPWGLTDDLIDYMLKAEGKPDYLQLNIIEQLGLVKVGEIENPEQIVGNCTWASFEAALEASFVSGFISQGVENDIAHKLAKESFTLWEQFDLNYQLNQVIENKMVLIQYGIYDDLLIKALETHHNPADLGDIQRGVVILDQLQEPTVFVTFDQLIGHYVIDYQPNSYKQISYMQSYAPTTYYEYFKSYFESPTLTLEQRATGKEYYEFLSACDIYQKELKSSHINITDVLDLSYRQDLENIIFDNISNPKPTVFDASLPYPIQPHMMLAVEPPLYLHQEYMT